MIEFPLKDVSNKKPVFSSPVKSFQTAWRWMFYISAGLFPLQLLNSSSSSIYVFGNISAFFFLFHNFHFAEFQVQRKRTYRSSFMRFLCFRFDRRTKNRNLKNDSVVKRSRAAKSRHFPRVALNFASSSRCADPPRRVERRGDCMSALEQVP